MKKIFSIVFLLSMVITVPAWADFSDNFNTASLDTVKWPTIERTDDNITNGNAEIINNELAFHISKGYNLLQSANLEAIGNWDSITLSGSWYRVGSNWEQGSATMSLAIVDADDPSRYISAEVFPVQGKIFFSQGYDNGTVIESQHQFAAAAYDDFCDLRTFKVTITPTQWDFKKEGSVLDLAGTGDSIFLNDIFTDTKNIFVKLGGSDDHYESVQYAYFDNINVTNVNATPEPVSSLLFLLGGSSLLALRRKNK